MIYRPMLSVLVPAYNAEKFIADTLAGLQQQTFTDFEILVADDKSTDRTREIIDAFNDSRITTFHNERNMGKTQTVQKLFFKANGKYVTIHDADDISLPERFEKQIMLLETNDELGMCGTSFITISEDGEFFSEDRMPDNYEEIAKAIYNTSQFHGPTMIMRASALKELGEVYRPYFKDNYEDTDLAFRLVQKYKCVNLDSFLYKYRIISSSLCRKNVDIRNRNLYKVVSYLGRQRSERGYDDLMIGKPDLVDQYFDAVTKHYDTDPSRINREAAAYFMYWKLTKRAIDESFKAIRKEPFKPLNWRTLFYCLRKG